MRGRERVQSRIGTSLVLIGAKTLYFTFIILIVSFEGVYFLDHKRIVGEKVTYALLIAGISK